MFLKSNDQQKKKAPPRPPPPNFSKLKSKSTHNINKHFDPLNLIDWSPPNSPKPNSNSKFGGSVSSSFSSSTSSLASSKKSATDYEGILLNTPPFYNGNTVTNPSSIPSASNINSGTRSTASLFGPTIIRPQQKKTFRIKPESQDDLPSMASLPMPTVPPPSPPKDIGDVITPYGIAQFDFPASQQGDLGLEIDDVVILVKRINKEWLYGQIGDQEGMFPENFINVMVPLPEDIR